MSYYNYIEVDEEEYQQLKNQARERNSLKNRLNKAKKQNRNLSNRINKIQKEFNNRVEQLNQENEKLNKSLKNLNKNFINQQKEFNIKYNSLEEKIDKTYQELNQNIETLREDTKKAIQNQQQQIQNIETTLKLEKETKQNLANEWLKNVDVQIDMIKKLNHEKFKPNALNKLITQLTLAKDNIKNGVYEAAISSLQERYLESEILFEEVFLLQKEFEELQIEALKNLDELYDLLEIQKEVEFEINSETIKIDVDYWSEGGITKIKEILDELAKKIDDEKTTTEELVEIIKRENELFEIIKKLPNQAKDNLILAEARIGIGNNVIDILDELGFEAIDDTFDRDDKRKSLFVKFENSAQEEIIVVLSPKENKNKMNIMFNAQNTNIKLKEHRLQRILKELNNTGVEVSNFSCLDSTIPADKIKEYQDFEKIKKGEVETKSL